LNDLLRKGVTDTSTHPVIVD